jgi:hypothetical protein
MGHANLHAEAFILLACEKANPNPAVWKSADTEKSYQGNQC